MRGPIVYIIYIYTTSNIPSRLAESFIFYRFPSFWPISAWFPSSIGYPLFFFLNKSTTYTVWLYCWPINTHNSHFYLHLPYLAMSISTMYRKQTLFILTLSSSNNNFNYDIPVKEVLHPSWAIGCYLVIYHYWRSCRSWGC